MSGARSTVMSMDKETLTRWAVRVERFNSIKLRVISAAGGCVGLALSLMAGTTLVWLTLGVVVAAVVAFAVFGLGRRMPRFTALEATGLALSIFIHQLVLDAPVMYFSLLGIAVAGFLVPRLLRVLARFAGGEAIA